MMPSGTRKKATSQNTGGTARVANTALARLQDSSIGGLPQAEKAKSALLPLWGRGTAKRCRMKWQSVDAEGDSRCNFPHPGLRPDFPQGGKRALMVGVASSWLRIEARRLYALTPTPRTPSIGATLGEEPTMAIRNTALAILAL